MLVRLFITALVSFSTPLLADGLTPFNWHYDVTYERKGKEYQGTGSYELRAATRQRDLKQGEDRYEFIAYIRGDNDAFKSTDTLLLKYDANNYVIPIQRRRKMLIYNAFPINRKIKITPPVSGPYYDTSSATLFLTEQLRRTAAAGQLTLAKNNSTPKVGEDDESELIAGQRGEARRNWRIWLADENKWEEFYLDGEETITAPIGEIECYVIKKQEQNPGRSFTVWIAKDGFYVAKLDSAGTDERTLMLINTIPATSPTLN